MCTCASCEYTDRFSGLPDMLDGVIRMDHKHGWDNWPRGDPAGSVSSAKDYKAHSAHCGLVMPKPWRYVSKPPTFSTAGLVMPIAPNALAVRWNAGKGQTSQGPVLGAPARPVAACKPLQHFPARIGADRASAKIYAMDQSKAKRPVGRPPIDKGGAKVRRVLIALDPESLERGRKLGAGNLSAGIRKAIAQASG